MTWVFGDVFRSDVWIWHPSTYEAAYKKAGFVDVEFFGFQVPPRWLFDKATVEWLRPRVMTPPVIGIRARRPH